MTSHLVKRSSTSTASAIRKGRMLLGDDLFFLGSKENFTEQQQSADHNGAIGYVEGRPVMGADIEIQEVDHAPAHHAVPQIAQSAAEHERERDGGGVQALAVLPQQGGD